MHLDGGKELRAHDFMDRARIEEIRICNVDERAFAKPQWSVVHRYLLPGGPDARARVRASGLVPGDRLDTPILRTAGWSARAVRIPVRAMGHDSPYASTVTRSRRSPARSARG